MSEDEFTNCRLNRIRGDESPPRSSAQRRAAIRRHVVRSTATVGGGRSPLAFGIFASMNFDARIQESIKGTTLEHPKDLCGILAYVDSRERVVLTCQELSDGLSRLIRQGRVIEAVGRSFYENKREAKPSSFRGLTAQEYQQACESYQESFRTTTKRDKNR